MPSFQTTIFITPSHQEVQVYLVSPSKFIQNYQQQLLPNWKVPIAQIILVLQQSQISFTAASEQLILEKDRLRNNFIRWGTNLIFQLQDQGYISDLFDPRNGYPLLAPPGKSTFDDNVAIKTLLDYPLINFKNCSLISHPRWGESVYPSSIATSAPPNIIQPAIAKLLIAQGLKIK